MAEITGDFIRSNAAFKQIPILTLDKNYYKIFSDEADKPETIKVLEEKVNDLLKKQGQINNDIKEVKKIKSRLIQGVVDDMEQDDTDPKHIKKMNESQKLIQEAKEKIADLEDEALEVPRKLSAANQELLIATIRYCYSRMNSNKEDIHILDKWINDTRVKLKKKLLIKQDKETKNDQMYGCLHDILGQNLMGILDDRNEMQE
ncbi:MAG: hypothetical protein ACI4EJ_05960 [Bacteroides sp.]|nr:hypothetical protein [Clostridia bacterium]